MPPTMPRSGPPELWERYFAYFSSMIVVCIFSMLGGVSLAHSESALPGIVLLVVGLFFAAILHPFRGLPK